MYVLYGGNVTRSLLVEMVLAEGELAYDLRNVDTEAGEHRAPEFLKINPAGWVPALVTPDGEVLYETPAINLHLAEIHGLEQLVPPAGDPQRGQFLCGLFYITGEIEPAMKRYYYAHRFSDGLAQAPVVKARAIEHLRDCLTVIDRRLTAKGPFHLGDRFSLVDLTMTYWARSIEEGHVLEGLDAVKACMARVAERPRLVPLFARLQRMMDGYFDTD